MNKNKLSLKNINKMGCAPVKKVDNKSAGNDKGDKKGKSK
jgi:hypothetical protein